MKWIPMICPCWTRNIFKAGSLYVIPKVFAALVVTIALALFLTFMVGKIERLLMPWRRQL